jgi:hypothetical protein
MTDPITPDQKPIVTEPVTPANIIPDEKKPEPSPLDTAPEAKKEDTKKEPEAKYEFKAPEGFDTKELEAFAKAEKISPATAQKLLDREFKVAADIVKYQDQMRAEDVKKGLQEIYADPVLGGKNIEQTKATVANVWNSIPADLRKEITDLGYHNDKRLIRLLHHVGQGMKEGKFIQPNADAPPPKSAMSALEALYTPKSKTE